MAPPERDELLGAEEESSAEKKEKISTPKKGKSKKRRGCGFFLILLLLGMGALAGLQLSGGVDVRPYVFPVVPKLPVIGQEAAKLMDIPPIYSLTVDERRKQELEEWETEIANRMRSLDQQGKLMDKVSKDLVGREKSVLQSQEEIQRAMEALSQDIPAGGAPASAETEAEIKRLQKTFEEMSPRNAAAILEKTSEALAVNLLSRMAEDLTAKILAKMKPEQAAVLTEQLSQLKK